MREQRVAFECSFPPYVMFIRVLALESWHEGSKAVSLRRGIKKECGRWVIQ